ncbi:PqiC family protein [Uliginosibacterium sediminicola]|uniref:PqiC family protein n=1 Tax=Uliginosibacterium sediminicola TaxID=2024550 RepID=A0ABU9Z2L9_9RHOO
MTARLRIHFAALLLALSACASPPAVHFYTLQPAAPALDGASAPVEAAPFFIALQTLSIPIRLDQPQLSVRQGERLVMLETERWAGPLDEELRAAFSAALTEQLATQDLSGLPLRASKPVMRIQLQVRRLDAWLGKVVEFEADWSLSFVGEATPALNCHSRFSEPAAAGYGGMVQAVQRSVVATAQQIAQDARRWAQSRNAACTPP